MLTSQTQLVSSSINCNVFRMPCSKLVNSLTDNFNSSFFTHSLGGNVGMHSSSVPVTSSDGLGMETAVHLKVFTHTLKDVARHHELISCLNTNTGSDLVFLLSGHNFSVTSRDIDSCIQTCLVVSINDVTSKRVLWSYGAVVRTLRTSGHTSLWPPKRSLLIKIEKSKFLLQSEPDFFVFLSFESLGSNSTSVARKRLTSRSVGITHDKNIIKSIRTRTEGISKNSLGL
mmetsp:Transcript_12755/g.23914  ORF Transcript_12755/g.23914 Transcript_12755/m.23914 type:complete len:229 (-) Transcript_12755:620-1306(-)